MRTIGVSAQSNPPNRQQTVPVPQSRHYPIKLLCHGNDRSWSISLGPKGPEKWERPGYPPIPLEPGAVAQEGAADSWIYRAKDTATGADVAVRLQRQACSEPSADKPLPFTVAAEHAQLGSFAGCANFAPELFPTEKQEDKDEEPKKPPPSYLSLHSKPPVAVAYHNQDGKWQLWTSPASDPMTASLLDHDNLDSIDDWADMHTLLANDMQNLVWIG